MALSDRLRTIRESKRLTQQDIQRNAGFTLDFIEQVESGGNIPSLEALECWARVLSEPLERFFYDGDEAPILRNLPNRLTSDLLAKCRKVDTKRSSNSERSCKRL